MFLIAVWKELTEPRPVRGGVAGRGGRRRLAVRLPRPRGGLDGDPRRAALRPRGGAAGPLIVEEYDATCLVPPGARAALDDYGSIVIDL